MEPENAPDPIDGRRPTSHEQRSGESWDASYRDGPAPWDIGGPQPAVVRLVADGGFRGSVLDAGCGTGDNSLHVASAGLAVLGIDVAETAVGMARAEAAGRGLDTEFAVADALDLARLERRFDTVLDCGLFHTFDGDERSRYVAGLASITTDDATVYVLCFSDQGPDTGPHPVRRDELEAAFRPDNGWRVESIERDTIHTRFHVDGAPAWLATISRINDLG